MTQPFPHKPLSEGGIRIVFNEIHRTDTGDEDFNGLLPDGDMLEPKYGSIIYDQCGDSGLFDFQRGQVWGSDNLDWINIWRVIPYIDLANITDFTVSVVPPEIVAGMAYPEAEWVSGLTDYTSSLMEKLLHLSNSALILRPGSQLKITTAGATVPQMVEVWWERARQIRPNEVGTEVFAYPV